VPADPSEPIVPVRPVGRPADEAIVDAEPETAVPDPAADAATPDPGAGGPISIEVIETAEAFDALHDEWNAAALASVDANVFLTWEWQRTWWRHFGEERSDAHLHIVVLRDDRGLVAAAPLFRTERGVGPVRVAVLHQIGHDAGDYGGILLVRRHAEAVDALLAHCSATLRQGHAAVVLSRLASDSVLLARLRASHQGDLVISESELPDAVCPFTDVREGYNLTKHLKKHKIRQRLRRLSEKHEVAFEYHTGATLDEGLDRLVTVHQRRWDEHQDEMQGLFADTDHAEFLLDGVRALDGAGWVRLLTLTADDRTVAAELDFDFARRVYMFKGAFDPSYGEFSPGQLITYRVFEDGIAQGVEEFDFMRGDHPYKRRWTNGDRSLVTVTLSRKGLVGKLAVQRHRAARGLETRFG
jgi:CelD/BcsL family acetyltransferase involved in cellulose biosynthesis